MMDVGTGLAICGSVAAVSFPVMGIVIASVKAKTPTKEVSVTCMAHSGIEAILKGLQTGQEEIKEDIRNLFETLNGRRP